MPIRPISRELQQKAQKELNEDPSRTSEHLDHMREWLAEQPHLHGRTEDQWLLNFLRSCHFDMKRTQEKMDLFYTSKTLLPELFSNRDPFLPEIQEVLSQGFILPLLKTDGAAGPRIVLCRYDVLNPKISFETLAKACLMIVDIMMYEDDNAVISGEHAFMDMKGISMEYLHALNYDFVNSFEICLEKAYPSRPKKFDVVNSPGAVTMIYNLFGMFLPERLTSMIHIYDENDQETVYETVPRSLFPPEYGGEGDSIKDLIAHWKSKVESYKDWFLEDEQYRSDEAKRPGKPKTAADVFPSKPKISIRDFD